MENKKILVVDDEPDFIMILQDILEKENFTVISAGDGEEGLKKARESKPDLIFLDWRLPIIDGLEVCKILKQDPKSRHIPIIMLTIKSTEADTIVCLEMGADDFITKPFRPGELVARMKAVLRRAVQKEKPETEVLKSDNICVDLSKHVVSINGEVLELRPKEFDLLRILMQKKGKALSRAFLTESIWGFEYFGSSRAVDTTITRLRSKLGKYSQKIETVEGIGYRFVD